jgi:hypothetical protein
MKELSDRSSIQEAGQSWLSTSSSVRDQIEQEEPFSEAPPSEEGLGVPRWLRIMLGLIFATLLIVAVVLLYGYLSGSHQEWKPAELDIIDLLVFCVLGLTVCLLPWEQYQIKIKKIGPFEFERVLSSQAQEHAVALDELHEHVHAIAEGKTDAASSRKQLEEIQSVLRRLFSACAHPISLSRIVGCASHQTGFEQLAQYQAQDVRRALYAMVAEGSLETTVSKRGNTLYRARQSQR